METLNTKKMQIWIVLSELLAEYLQQWLFIKELNVDERKNLEGKIKHLQKIILLESPYIVTISSSAIVILQKLSDSDEFLRYSKFFIEIIKKRENINAAFLNLDEQIHHYYKNLKK